MLFLFNCNKNIFFSKTWTPYATILKPIVSKRLHNCVPYANDVIKLTFPPTQYSHYEHFSRRQVSTIAFLWKHGISLETSVQYFTGPFRSNLIFISALEAITVILYNFISYHSPSAQRPSNQLCFQGSWHKITVASRHYECIYDSQVADDRERFWSSFCTKECCVFAVFVVWKLHVATCLFLFV